MILTNCAACAAPLAHDAPRCVRCHMRYCSSTCQHDHWRRGHKQICKKIRGGGFAEQYHANKKYKEAVAVAVEACADDTKGQTCYICTEAVHWKTKEGLVRMCACRGTAGFVHVSCLATQAKMLVEKAEDSGDEDNLDEQTGWDRWYECRLCEQDYHGVVLCALGWACWKTYVGRPETNFARIDAMTALGLGLGSANRHDESLRVTEAELATKQRAGHDEESLLVTRTNVANCLFNLGRAAESLSMTREIFADSSRLNGPDDEDTIIDAINLSESLIEAKLFGEARSLLRDNIPVARRTLGTDHELTLDLRSLYACTIYSDTNSSRDVHEAVAILEDVLQTTRRVFGTSHPNFMEFGTYLENARMRLADDESRAADA